MDVWYTDGHNQVLQLVSFCVLAVCKPTLHSNTYCIGLCITYASVPRDEGNRAKCENSQSLSLLFFFVVTRSRSMVEIGC